MKKLKKITISILIAILCCFALSIVACDVMEDDYLDDVQISDSGQSTSNSQNSTTSNSGNSKTCYLNETITNKDSVSFKVNSVLDTQEIGDGYFVETTDANYVVINMTISNNGDEAYSINPYNFVLKKGDKEYEYSSDSWDLEDSISLADDINPGISKTVQIAFETPEENAVAKYTLSCGTYEFLTSSVFINLWEKEVE